MMLITAFTALPRTTVATNPKFSGSSTPSIIWFDSSVRTLSRFSPVSEASLGLLGVQSRALALSLATRLAMYAALMTVPMIGTHEKNMYKNRIMFVTS